MADRAKQLRAAPEIGITACLNADVVELVDTQDLKS